MAAKTKVLDKKISTLNEQIKKLEGQKEAMLCASKWKCPKCKKHTPIKKIDLIQSWYEVNNYDGYDQVCSDDYKIVCPKCDEVLRYHEKKQDQYEFIQENEDRFGGLVKDMCERTCFGKVKYEVEKSVQLNWKDEEVIRHVHKDWRNVSYDGSSGIFE